MWLDLARYADTKGYEKDQPRTIWRYRDWVINAFNSDLPFDQFTRDQLAGDLLPAASDEQLLATAFHRNTMTNDEGGTDNEEFRIAAVKDRVDTTVQVWMGLTMGCAKCHSHKYDPISHHDYYRFMAYFNQTEDEDRADDAPLVATPTPEQKRQVVQLQSQLADLNQKYLITTPEFAAAQQTWELQLADTAVWHAMLPVSAASANGTILTPQTDHSILASGPRPANDIYTITVQAATAISGITSIRLEALTHPSLPGNGPGRTRTDPNFVLSELTIQKIDAQNKLTMNIPIQSAKADYSQPNWPVANAFDNDPKTGWAISPQQGQAHVAIFELSEPVNLAAGQCLKVALSQQYAGNSLLLGRIRLSFSQLAFENLSAEPQTFAEIAAIPRQLRSEQQQQQITDQYRRLNPDTAPLRKQIEQLEQQIADARNQIPRTPIMRDRPEERARKTFVHLRGNFLDPGEQVEPGLPLSFASPDYSHADNPPADRRAVAQWLTSAENPLTARVMVNRLWARVFGRGIVETEEDFGLQGTMPTHPELLDWLAVEFRETHQWSVKKLLRSIVLSATYQQSNQTTASAWSIDPDNRWLSRSPRFRLPAEVIRDQAMAASGLLTNRIGGPSVMPPQPDGIWKATYSSMKWQTADGPDRYRRAIYTFLRRTSPYPSMLTFDAGSGEVCQIRRIRTNTPLQALVTLNDAVFVEAAGALAQTAIQAAAAAPGTATRDKQATQDSNSKEADLQVTQGMFRRTLIRPAEPNELQRLNEILNQARAEFLANPDAAKQLILAARLTCSDSTDPADLAAHVVVANVILNLDEALMKP